VSGEPNADPRRRFNDDRQRLFGSDADRLIAFVCECTDADCRQTVLLTAHDYERSRVLGRVLHDGHTPLPQSP